MKCVELATDLVPAKRSDVPDSNATSAQVHFERYANVGETCINREVSRTVDTSDNMAKRPSGQRFLLQRQAASLGNLFSAIFLISRSYE